MAPLFKGSFLVLLAFLLTVSEARLDRRGLRRVPENALESTGAAVPLPEFGSFSKLILNCGGESLD